MLGKLVRLGTKPAIPRGSCRRSAIDQQVQVPAEGRPRPCAMPADNATGLLRCSPAARARTSTRRPDLLYDHADGRRKSSTRRYRRAEALALIELEPYQTRARAQCARLYASSIRHDARSEGLGAGRAGARCSLRHGHGSSWIASGWAIFRMAKVGRSGKGHLRRGRRIKRPARNRPRSGGMCGAEGSDRARHRNVWQSRIKGTTPTPAVLAGNRASVDALPLPMRRYATRTRSSRVRDRACARRWLPAATRSPHGSAAGCHRDPTPRFAIGERLSPREWDATPIEIAFSWTHAPQRDEDFVVYDAARASRVAELTGDESCRRGRLGHTAGWPASEVRKAELGTALTERTVGVPLPVLGMAAWAQGRRRARNARIRSKPIRSAATGVMRQDGCCVIVL